VDEAMRDPISVAMLKIDGSKIIKLGERPGPRIGFILHALLEEVLDDPQKNAEEHLEASALKLMGLGDAELQKLGEQGKTRREEEDEAEIQKLREKHHVG
ncbi:MAG: hypothetical protein NUV88_01740, partial [Candidatus Kaiserbacteria bacterium]|nr:hypothetical protein [Candidatus Kaiserbacteria bacterium]